MVERSSRIRTSRHPLGIHTSCRQFQTNCASAGGRFHCCRRYPRSLPTGLGGRYIRKAGLVSSGGEDRTDSREERGALGTQFAEERSRPGEAI